MKYQAIKLKDGELKVSRIALGTDYFGTSVPKETAFSLLDRYLERGGNCIDTARFYADWMPNGHGASERIIGEWLKSSRARDRLLISTKGGHPPIEDMGKSRLYAEFIMSDLDESLSALGTDHVDLYWLHRDSPDRPIEDIMENLRPIAESKKVRAFGCSNWRVPRIAEANRYARGAGLPPFCMSQIQWSLAASTPEAHGDVTKVIMNDQEFAGYVKQKLPIMCYSSQAKGFFVRPLSGPGAINKKSYDWFCSPENLERKERLTRYAAEKGLPPTAVALGYVLCNRLSAIALVGCRSIEQLDDSFSAQDVDIPLKDLDWLFYGDSSSQGDGGKDHR
jgi:Predicted oxidoreductases (related to aryl-alcohol dehydrogenases)